MAYIDKNGLVHPDESQAELTDNSTPFPFVNGNLTNPYASQSTTEGKCYDVWLSVVVIVQFVVICYLAYRLCTPGLVIIELWINSPLLHCVFSPKRRIVL